MAQIIIGIIIGFFLFPFVIIIAVLMTPKSWFVEKVVEHHLRMKKILE